MSLSQINKEEFLEFLELLRLDGFVKNQEILYSSGAQGIEACGRSNDKSFGFKCCFFGNYEDCGEVGIVSLESFIKFVSSLQDKFSIEYSSSKLKLIDKKNKVSLKFHDKEYIVNKLEPEKFEKVVSLVKKSPISFVFEPEAYKDLIKKFDAVYHASKKEDLKVITLTGVKNKLSLSIANKIDEVELISEYDVKVSDDDVFRFEISISNKFVDLLRCLDIPVDVRIEHETAKALLVSLNKKDCYNFEYLFALNINE